MDTDSDPQSHVDPTSGLSDYADSLVRTETDLSAFNLIKYLQADYLMEDAFGPQPEADADPPGYDFENFQMSILRRLPECIQTPEIQHHSFFDGIIGNEVSPSARYWETMQSPQSIPLRQGSEICLNPRYISSSHNLHSGPGGHFAMVGIENCICPPAVVSHNSQPIVNSGISNPSLTTAARGHEGFPLPSCQNDNCHPPPNPGLLSRRFTENKDWIQGRECAVPTLPHRRKGSKFVQNCY
jgi:hypothetical protein